MPHSLRLFLDCCEHWLERTVPLPSPLIEAFRKWRDEERWLRSYCPTCGSLPSMAQLVGKEPGRRRFLSCGCCGTRWPYKRTGCPFCDSQSDHRLSVLAIEGRSTSSHRSLRNLQRLCENVRRRGT
ncbi:MAG: hypothetical protein DMG64_17845 [Acidobacteria bacterium]|nr:MAG: hypothetical protein DMG64_17845 [Acidobacteriota bacterium]PYY00743.1 MAG: hypothetical protein DMG63_05145 [Acidobacteriota bacterium]PYY23913.1 MAG: hypothetical protein DMG62_05520 [Acidobacteriota bacterium]